MSNGGRDGFIFLVKAAYDAHERCDRRLWSRIVG